MTAFLRIRRGAAFLAKTVGLYHPINDWLRDRRFLVRMRAEMSAWESRGRTSPPPDIVKYRVIRHIARTRQISVLVETGTFYGDAIFFLRHDFAEIHSIELSAPLFERNVRELAHLSNIRIHLGDSAKVLPGIVDSMRRSVILWLDGHYCAGPSARGEKDTPIMEEMEHLLSRPAAAHAILIDDARLFTGKNGYPTLEQLRGLVLRHRPHSTMSVVDDIIHVVPV